MEPDRQRAMIYQKLQMKLRTVEKHIESILVKLKVPTRTAAALKGIQLGFIQIDRQNPSEDEI